MNPRITTDKKIRAILKLHLICLLILLYIGLFASTCLSIDVKIGDNEVTISWIKPTRNEDGSLLNDLAGYYIYRSEGISETFIRLNDEPVKGICYTDTTPVNGMIYFYTVTAVDYSGNESKGSPIISAAPNILPPSKIKVKPGDGEVQLFWEPYEKSVLKGYYVYRRNPLEKTFQRLTEIPIQETHFVDTQVANGIAYFYKVSCVGIDGIEGLYSPETGATPLAVIPEEPSGVHAKYILDANGSNQIELTWEKSKEENITGYRIYRRLLNESEFILLTYTPIEETQYTDTSILPEKGYLFSVVAVTERGMESQYPKEAKCFTSALYISSFTQDTGGKAKKAGDKICFFLRGEPGLLASYTIENLTSPIPMEETSEGTYNACLDITEEMSVEGARAIGFIEDTQGNRASKAAEGILIIDNQPPNIVKNAKAEWDTGTVKITWDAPEGEFIGCEIFRDVEGSLKIFEADSSRLPIKTVTRDKTFYYDAGIKPDRAYYYSICTLDRAGNSAGPIYLSPVYVPYQSGIPFIKTAQENTAGMPQKTGDRIEVELIGEEGCHASFFIPGIFEEAITLNEKSFGQYSGYYIVRPEDKSEQAVIQVCLKDDLGHTNCQNVTSNLIINCDLEDANPPVIYDINHNAFEIAGFSGDLVPGNILEVTLRGEAGCSAYFIITSSDSTPDGGDENEFEKQELLENPDFPGLYTGTYTIGWENESIDTAYIWGCMSDRAGNKVWKHSEESITLDIRPRIKVIPEDNILSADQESQTKVSIKVTDANDDPVEGHLIALTITTTDEYTGVVGGGDLGNQTSTDIDLDLDHTTDSWGEVEIEYTSGFAAKTAIIVAKDLTTGHAGTGYVLNFIEAQTDIELMSPPSRAKLLNAKPYKLILTADPDRITADGESTSTITAKITDRDGKPIGEAGAGVLISFSLDDNLDDIENGRLSSYQEDTDSSGTATTRYTAGIIRGTVTITGSCPDFDAESGSIQISLMSDAPAIMDLAANPNCLVANGHNQSTIKVWVADINKNPVQEAMVEFSILQDNRGTLSAITEATDFNGWAQCIYTSPSFSGQEPIFAKILAKVTSKVPTEEELARAMGTIFIPILHPEMEEEDEVKILEWLFRKGDEIKQGTPIVRIETQKVEYLLKAPVSGELVKINIHRGERVTLGEAVGQILTDEEFWEED